MGRSGKPLADVRDFVEQTKHLQSDTPVFTSYRGDA